MLVCERREPGTFPIHSPCAGIEFKEFGRSAQRPCPPAIRGLIGRTLAAITVDDFNRIMEQELSWAHDIGMRAQSIGDGEAVIRLGFADEMLRPGGTVAGPFMMALADAAMYAAVMGKLGVVKMAVTSNLNINFLHRPHPGALLAEARALKVGKRLAMLDVIIYSENHDEPVAHATGTYSVPQPND